jgi:hypothetical protein
MIYHSTIQAALAYNDSLRFLQVNTHLGRVYYSRTHDVFMPSITTITKSKPNAALDAWKKREGENAVKIARNAGIRGDAVHEAAENMLQGKPVKPLHPTAAAFWIPLRKALTQYTGMLAAYEHTIYHPILKVVGRFDLLVQSTSFVDDVFRTLDIKTSERSWADLKPEWQESRRNDYFLQLAVYADALRRHGVAQDNPIIYMTSDGMCVPLEMTESPQRYLEEFARLLQKFQRSAKWQNLIVAARKELTTNPAFAKIDD